MARVRIMKADGIARAQFSGKVTRVQKLWISVKATRVMKLYHVERVFKRLHHTRVYVTRDGQALIVTSILMSVTLLSHAKMVPRVMIQMEVTRAFV